MGKLKKPPLPVALGNYIQGVVAALAKEGKTQELADCLPALGNGIIKIHELLGELGCFPGNSVSDKEKQRLGNVGELKPTEPRLKDQEPKDAAAKVRDLLADLIGEEFDHWERSDDINWMSSGLDSGDLVKINQKLESEWEIEMIVTEFFEYQNLKEMADHLLSEFPDKFGNLI